MSKRGSTIPYLRSIIPVSKDKAEEIWHSLDASIALIFDFQASRLSFEELYRKAYDLVIQKYGDLLYNGLSESFKRQCTLILVKLNQDSQKNLFEKLFDSWINFKSAINMIKDILMYMDKNFVQTKGLQCVYDLGLSVFKTTVILNEVISVKIRSWILESIKNDRNQQMLSIDKLLIKNIISMLAEVSSREKNIYINVFEIHFIEESRVFYMHKAQEWISSDSCPEYLKKVEKILKEEKERVEAMMDQRTENLILGVVDECFIKSSAKVLANMENSGCFRMMESLQIDNLKRMYLLFSRVPESLKEISICLSASIEAEGSKIIASVDYKKNYTQLMQDLLKVREKYESIVCKSFGKDTLLQTAMKLSFEKCINKNIKTSIALTLYADYLLKKGIKSMSENEIDHIFDEIVILFRYISDKDIFERYYKDFLSNRLLSSQSLSDDAEKLLIRKLKIECGSHYTSKLEGMLLDMKLSKDSLKDYVLVNDNIEFRVLTAAFWPQYQIPSINIPIEFTQKMERFRKYYINRYSGRTFYWKTSLGNAEIRAFLGESREKHELITSTYQMAVLLLFNTKDSYKYEEICKDLDADDSDFDNHVLGLIKSGVLLKNTSEKKLNPSTEISLNNGYKHKMLRIKIPVLEAKEHIDDSADQEVPEVVEDDRKHMTEAAIVKIMKTRRVITHQQLIQETAKMVGWKFVASNKLIKSRIEGLIEREFLQRDPKDSNVYLYIV